MASNGSRKDSGQDPWGGGSHDGPPDLTQIIKKFFGKWGQPSDDSPGWGRLIGLGVLVLLVFWALSGIFLVSPAEESVVLRFGKYVSTAGPGPHWIPPLIEKHYTQDVQRVDSFPYQSEMLTKDGNIVSVKIEVQYRIADLKNYLFKVVEPVNTLHQAAASALRQVVGQMELDPILTTGREELAEKVMVLLQETMKSYQSGIEVREVALQSSKPPEQVTAAFDDVIKATEDEKRYINQADAYAKKRVLIAQGEVSRIEQQAKAYRYSVVARANGATARYLALLKPYEQAPRVTRERLYLDTMDQVLQNSHVLIDGGGNNVLYLPLEQLLAKSVKTTHQTAQKSIESMPTDMSSVEDIQANTDTGFQRPSYPLTGESQ